MPSQFVWKSFERFTRWSEGLWTPPITFAGERREFIGTAEYQRLVVWYISSFMVIITGFLMSILLLRNLFSPTATISMLEFVFVIFYIACALLILVLMHLSSVLRSYIVEAMNQLLKLDKTLNRWGFLDAGGWDSVGMLMHGFLLISNLTPIVLAVFGVYEQIDAIFLFLGQFLDSSTISSSLSLTLFRFAWLLVAVAEVWKQIGFYSLSCLLVLQIVSKVLAVKTEPANSLIYKRHARRRLQIQWRFNQAYIIYRRLQLIIFSGMNPTLVYFVPYFMAFGLILCILCDFATISLHGEMNSALLIVMPGMSFGVKFIIYTLLPQACRVNDEAAKFSRDWRKIAPIANLLSRRKLRCLIPLRFHAGTFFYCKRSTKSTYFSVIMHYTITAAISINSPGILKH